MPADPYRLPRHAVPHHYDLALAPDLRACRFEGTATISISVLEETRSIVFNAVELELHSVSLRDASGAGHVASVTLDDRLERATATFPEAIPAGDATLTIAYTGNINDKLRGFYRSTFTDAAGDERVIATTQFESTDARRAFPCWDEPEYKATFSVSLLVPPGNLGLSNGAAVAQRETEDGTWVTFDKTMKMSTYLVAFVVGPLVTTAPVDVDGVPLRVACVPGREHLATFALEVGAHALRFLADYFAIPYPAGKLDLVALPDFAFGAMENVGCVTFRETALLVDATNASRTELERVADVVSHEIAHMWFGDLVTMKWWNGIWLNEAFATFMELTTVDAFRPSWERWVSFSSERAAALVTDALASTRPIEYEVVSPDEAEGMFDVLTYQKGGAVLRMLETYLGAERFRDGIRLYLDRHRYANTETTDLWDAIEEATGEPVRSIMDSWIFQGGHPVITADQDGDAVTLHQRRFRYLSDPEGEQIRWEVPILIRGLDGDGVTRALLDDSSARVSVASHPSLVNAGGWGVFRTRYTGVLREEVIASIGRLDPVERANLVSDAWSLVLGGQSPLEEFVALVECLGAGGPNASLGPLGEGDPDVWSHAATGLDHMHRALPASAQPAFAAWVRRLAGPRFASLGWEPAPDEDDKTARLRGALVELLGTFGQDEEVIRTARRLHGERVAPDLLSPIATVIAWNGDEHDYEMFWQRIKGATTPQDEVRYLFRLPIFPGADLLLRTLEATFSEVRSQNGAFLIAGSIANRTAGRRAWLWLTEHWDEVLKRLPDNTHGRVVDGASRLTDSDSVVEVPEFLGAHPLPNARHQVAQLLERQQVNAAFAGRARPDLEKRFRPSEP